MVLCCFLQASGTDGEGRRVPDVCPGASDSGAEGPPEHPPRQTQQASG